MLYDLSESDLAAHLAPWIEAAQSGRLGGFGLSQYIRGPGAGEPGPARPIRLAAVFDNDPELWGRTAEVRLWGQEPQTVQILPPERLAQGRAERPLSGGPDKIVVFTSSYDQAKAQLNAAGLREFDDFMSAADFYLLYHWFARGRIHFRTMGLFVAEKCNLRCRDCCVLAPKGCAGLPALDELISDLDLLMSRIDRLQILELYGGEPLLNPELPDFIDYIGQNHRRRIERLAVFTNGSLPPGPELIRASLAYGRVDYLVSDYRDHNSPAYAARFEKATAALRAAGLPVRELYWESWLASAFTGPEPPALVEPGRAAGHYAHCWVQPASHCYLFTEGRLYNCAVARRADRLGWVRAEPGDYLDFRSLGSGPRDRFEIVRRYLGYCPRGYLAACPHCYGFCPEAPAVPVAVQEPARAGLRPEGREQVKQNED